MPHQSLTEYLEYFSRYGRDVAYVHRRGYRTVRWTYRQLAQTAAQFARELEARGIQPGERVVLWGENCAEWVAVFWGCLLRGAVVVPVDRIATPDFAQTVARQVDAKLCVRSMELSGGEDWVPSITLEALPELLAPRSREPLVAAPRSRSDMAEILFTSGATGEPKGVVLTHGNLLANVEPFEVEIDRYRKYERLVHPLRFLNLVPLSHIFGQFVGLLVPPLIGGTVILHDTLNPSEVARTIRRERVSLLVAVPRMLESLKTKIERDLDQEGRSEWFHQQFSAAGREHFLKRWWRFRRLHRKFGWKFWALASGGATLDAETEAFWSRLGFAVIQGYGLTETAALITMSHPFRLSRGSVGREFGGREVKLDEHGEILVRGENVAAAYWQGRERVPITSEVAGEPGWFRTGDLGERDAQGNLYFKGRKKNVIVDAAGMNIYPEDLEAALRRQPEVRDCVVVGVARNGNEEPCAVLLLRPDAAAPEAIVRRANESLADFQRMRLWYAWPAEDFPRTATQKPRLNIIRSAVAQELVRPGGAERLPAGAAAARGASPVEELIQRITRRPAAGLSPNATLESDLNLGSLDRVELLSALEDRFQTDLSETQFSAAKTVRDLEQLVQQQPVSRFEYPYARWTQRWPVALFRGLVYYLLVWPATLLMAWPRVRGREHLRGLRGPLLFVPNHVTEIDIGFVLAALPLRFRHRLAVAMVGERLRDLRHPPAALPWFRRWFDPLGYLLVTALFNVFSMPKESGVRASFQFAGESVDRGYSLAVFPEGQLTRDGRVGTFRGGIGVLAQKLNIPVVPIKIDGLYELREAGRRFARPGTVRVVIGTPVRFGVGDEPEQIARQLQERVAALSAA